MAVFAGEGFVDNFEHCWMVVEVGAYCSGFVCDFPNVIRANKSRSIG
jgi:hypothetical protein